MVYFLFLEVYGGRIEVFWGVDGMGYKEGGEGFYGLEVRCWGCDDVCGCVCICVEKGGTEEGKGREEKGREEKEKGREGEGNKENRRGEKRKGGQTREEKRRADKRRQERRDFTYV